MCFSMQQTNLTARDRVMQQRRRQHSTTFALTTHQSGKGRNARPTPILAVLLAVLLLMGGFPASLQSQAEDATRKVTALPTEAIPGASIVIEGEGFLDNAAGELRWAEAPESFEKIETDGSGRFSAIISVPEAEGQHSLEVTVDQMTDRTSITVSSRAGAPVALGIFHPGAPADIESLARVEEQLGRVPEIVMWYQHWGFPDTRAFDPKLLTAVDARGAVPMITWEPRDPRKGLRQGNYQLRDLCTKPGSRASRVQKANNAYVNRWAAGLAAYDKPVLLRFAHEMNGTWYPWAAGVNGNTAADYVSAWKCLRARFKAKGADNVKWVWSPNVSFFGSTPLKPLYPGDAAVNWLALDGYNWYNGGGPPDQWQSFGDIFGASLGKLAELSDKPVMIAETASAEEGGDKAAWILDAMSRDLPLDYPQVRAFIWFNQNKERDWRFTSSDSARAAFRAAANHPYYRGDLSP